MPAPSRPRLLAIGLDAAEPWLVRHLAERGDMPTLRKLLAGGASGRVTSTAHIGALTVWPTFVSGTSVWEHEKYSFWFWDPSRMRVDVTTYASLQPFWRAAEWASRTVGVLDVPMSPYPVARRGFEIAEWGSHNVWLGAMHACPPSLESRVRALVGEYPTRGLLDASATGRLPTNLLEQCVDGAQRRGRLLEELLREESPEVLLTVFTESHRAGHFFWHTLPRVAAHPATLPPPGGPELVEVFREIDRQLGRILTAAGDDTTVLVFSLHGMRDARGYPSLLDPVLSAAGLATPAAESLLSKFKRRTPTPVKHLYHRLAPQSMRWDVATSAMTPRYDWSRTQAFPLPTDQHGWIRVNLKDREAAGIVEPSDYGRLCGEIEQLLYGLRTEDGHPVVNDVVRTSPHPSSSRLPDLVVHWTPAATSGAFRLRDPAIRCEMEAPKLTGEHTPEGFWVFNSPRPGGPANGASLTAEGLGRLLTARLPTS